MPHNLSKMNMKSRTAADVAEVADNIQTNLSLLDQWLMPCPVNKHKAILVSGGRSLIKHIDRIKEESNSGAHIYCVKHSVPALVEADIPIKGVICLDARPAKGTTTHGKSRSKLYEMIPKDTTVFIATMTHYGVTQKVQDELGLKTVGWQAVVPGIEQFPDLLKNHPLVTIGTCSAIRGIGVLLCLGYRDIDLVAYDADVSEPDERGKKLLTPEGGPKYLEINIDESPESPSYWTTGELLCVVQDLKFVAKEFQHRADITMWDGGLGCMAFQQEQKSLRDIQNNNLDALDKGSLKDYIKV